MSDEESSSCSWLTKSQNSVPSGVFCPLTWGILLPGCFPRGAQAAALRGLGLYDFGLDEAPAF